MARIVVVLLALVLLTSCESKWSDEDQEMYYQSCYQDAVSWAGSEENAKAYCNCMKEKLMIKYPDINELVEHMHEIGADRELQQCKLVIKR